ncbi:MAG TPA: hypothetical protein VL424_11515, partial [Pararobbsia sp.]|nr:hypothetical protein [Pararobbsia sp.]
LVTPDAVVQSDLLAQHAIAFDDVPEDELAEKVAMAVAQAAQAVGGEPVADGELAVDGEPATGDAHATTDGKSVTDDERTADDESATGGERASDDESVIDGEQAAEDVDAGDSTGIHVEAPNGTDPVISAGYAPTHESHGHAVEARRHDTWDDALDDVLPHEARSESAAGLEHANDDHAHDAEPIARQEQNRDEDGGSGADSGIGPGNDPFEPAVDAQASEAGAVLRDETHETTMVDADRHRPEERLHPDASTASDRVHGDANDPLTARPDKLPRDA